MPAPIAMSRRPLRPVSASSIDIPTPTLHYRMNEGSGNALETIAGLDMTDNNTVTSAAGIVSTARQFTVANLEYFTRADDNAFHLDTTGAIGVWVYLDSVTGQHYFLSHNIGNGVASYAFFANGSTIQFYYKNNVSSYLRNVLVGASINTWYCLMAKWDGANLYSSVNGAAWGTGQAATVAPVTVASAVPWIGAISTGAGGVTGHMAGRIDIATWWKGILPTDAQVANFYNSGAGHEYNGSAWV